LGTPQTSSETAEKKITPASLIDSSDRFDGTADAIESALAKAIEGATVAGKFDVVAELCRELEARRLTRAGNVVRLDARRKGGAP